MTNILALSVATITLFWERCGVTMAQGVDPPGDLRVDHCWLRGADRAVRRRSAEEGLDSSRAGQYGSR